MLRIFRSEYDATHSDFKGVWTTERDDQPNWERDRHLYMGKRTIMSGDGSCSLCIEGLSLKIYEDAEYRRYLLHGGGHGAVVFLPRALSSEGYGKVYRWFDTRFKTDGDASLVDLRDRKYSVWYQWGLSGPDGAWYQLVRLPDTRAEDLEAAESYIRRSFDVVKLHVLQITKLHDIQEELDIVLE